MSIDRFFRRPPTSDDWRARTAAIQSRLEGLTIDELMRGPAKQGQPAGRGGYDSNQPRVPAGHSDGGQWTSTGVSGPGINDPRILSDITPDNDWIPDADYAAVGHHWYARQFYERHMFTRETRRVFRDATSGPLVNRLWSRRRGRGLGHGQDHGYDHPHREYDRAVDELVTRYMRDRGMFAQQMTPDQAREVVELIKRSPDPRIQPFVRMINILRRFYRMYRARGLD